MYEITGLIEFDDLNDYFINEKSDGTGMYFAHFLCRYEKTLTAKARQFIKQYFLEDNRLDDLKQIFAAVLWDKLKDYGAESSLPFLQFVRYDVLREWHRYTALNCGATAIHNEKAYTAIRKAAQIYYSIDDLPEAERIKMICLQLGISEIKAKEYIGQAKQFRFTLRLETDDTDDDASEYSVSESQVSERSPSAEDEYLRLRRRQVISETAARLTSRELAILTQTTGVCPFCFGRITKSERKTYEELALIHGVSGGDVIEKQRKRVLKKLREALYDEGF